MSDMKMSTSEDDQASASGISSLQSDTEIVHCARDVDTIEHFEVCDNIYCDIDEETGEKEAVSWSDFWRRMFYRNKKQNAATTASPLKKGLK